MGRGQETLKRGCEQRNGENIRARKGTINWAEPRAYLFGLPVFFSSLRLYRM